MLAKPRHFFLFLLQFLTFNLSVYSQNREIDSLEKLVALKQSKDTFRVNILNELAVQYRRSDPIKSNEYANEAIRLSREIFYSPGESMGYNNLGVNNTQEGNYAEALSNILEALKIREGEKDLAGIAACYVNLGNIFYAQEKFNEALEYQEKALKIRMKGNDNSDIAVSYNNIGNIYYRMNDPGKSLENHLRAIDIREKINDKKGLSMSYHNLASIYNSKNFHEKALEYHFKALQIRFELNDKYGMAISYINISTIFDVKNQHKTAFNYLGKADSLAKNLNSKDLLFKINEALAKTYYKTGDFKRAYEYHLNFSNYKDSVFNEKSGKQIAEMQTKYETEKKQREIELLNLKNEQQSVVAKSEAEQQRLILYSVSGLLILVLSFSIYAYRSYLQKQAANLVLAGKNKIIEEKKKEITDSINYAKKIQQAILPPQENLNYFLPESFIFFKPKDIVSGDFYFFSRKVITPPTNKNHKEELIFIAVADCTGHGVPGAFMSMIGSEKLSKAVENNHEPGDILSALNLGIKNSLRQSEKMDLKHEGNFSTSVVKDGMDIALCSITPFLNEDNKAKVSYAGANRPIWIIRNGAPLIEEIKATKNAIGGFTSDDQIFENTNIYLSKGDSIYLFSDGFADQFGGENGKKLTTKKFKELLIAISGLPMADQKNQLNAFADNWKAGREQIDDVLVIGVKIV